MRCALRAALAAAAFLAVAPVPVHAQHNPRLAGRTPNAYLEYFVTEASRGAVPVDRDAQGWGGRLMFAVPGRGALADRLSVGAFVASLPVRENDASAWRYGAQTDVRLLSAARRVDPMFTLAVGATHTEMTVKRVAWKKTEIDRREETSLSLAPGFGARFHVGAGVALRGDIRRMIGLGANGRSGTEISGGLSLPL